MSEILFPVYLRAAVINQRIYPPGSPIVERSVSQIEQTLQGLLESDKVILTNRQGRIFVRGKEIPDAAALVPILEEHQIQSLTFLPGTAAPEISQLVILLSRKKLTDGSAAEWLQAQNVTHIQLDKVTVVEVMEGQVVIQKVDAIFNQVKDFPSLVGSLREAYDMMDQMPDPAQRGEVQEHMARKLAGMDASIIRDMFSNELPKRVEDSGLREGVLNAMTQDKLRDIFSEIGNWYKQVREQSGSEFEATERLNTLKSFLGKLLGAPASKAVPFSIYEELLHQGLLEQIPPHIQKQTEEESLAAQVDDLLGKPAAALLEPPVRDKLPLMLKKVCDLDLNDLAQRLTGKLLENFTEGTPLLRQMAVKTGRSFLEILWVNRKEKLWGTLYSSVEQLAEMERSSDVYKEITEALAEVAAHFVLNERFAEAGKTLSLLRRHAHEENDFIPKRPELAGRALQRVADEIIDVITEDLLSQDKLKKDSAQAILAHLGERAVPCFINMIKKSDDVRHRRLAASSLKYHADEAKSRLAAEFHLGNSTSVLLHILSILDDFLTPDLVPKFEALVHYPDPAIRRRIVQLLVKLPHSSAGQLLLKFLDDPDEATQVEAVRGAGETKNREAVLQLVDFLKGGSTLRLEETCLALGRIGDGQAVPALAEIIEQRSGLFKKRSGTEETVRVRATWALAQIRTAEARNVLTRALKDANLQVQSIARQALESQTF